MLYYVMSSKISTSRPRLTEFRSRTLCKGRHQRKSKTDVSMGVPTKRIMSSKNVAKRKKKVFKKNHARDIICDRGVGQDLRRKQVTSWQLLVKMSEKRNILNGTNLRRKKGKQPFKAFRTQILNDTNCWQRSWRQKGHQKGNYDGLFNFMWRLMAYCILYTTNFFPFYTFTNTPNFIRT